jgi:hypothetical protein
MGFRADMIQDRGDYFLVEGDIVFWKRDLQKHSGGLKPDFQWRTTNIVGNTTVHNIKVALSGLIAGWDTASREGMGEWDSISGVAIRFVEGTPAAITISRSSSLPPGVAAQATFPSGGNPGPSIQVSTSFDTLTPSQKKFVMAHELGHTIGFRHTNWQTNDCPIPPCSPGPDGAVIIGHTPQTDDNSVMNGGTAGHVWNGFSTSDLEAARVIYPMWPIISSNDTTTGNPEIIYWTRNAGAVGYIVSYHMLGMDSDINGNPVVVLYSGDHAYTTDTTWSNPGVTYTGDNSCQYAVRVKLVFASDTVDNWDNSLYLPICDPNWQH